MTVPARLACAGVSIVSGPETADDPLYDQPPPGSGTAALPDLIVADSTWWLSVSVVPVPPVKASRTVGGMVTALDRYCLPSTVTVIFPLVTVTPITCFPVRSGGTFVAVAANTSWPLLTPVAMPTKFDDG